MSTFNGHAMVYGVGTGDTVGMAVTGLAFYTQVFLDGVPIASRAKMDEHIGCNGITGAFVHTNPYLEITVTMRPASTTSITDVGTDLAFVPKGTTVVLSGFNSVYNAGANILNGTWLMIGDQTINLNKDDAATVDITLRRYVDPVVMTALSKQVVT